VRVGYARVSTVDQNPELQLEALRGAGCEKLFAEKASGAKDDRPELARVLKDVLRNVELVTLEESGTRSSWNLSADVKTMQNGR